MELYRLLAKRRMCRAYLERPVPRAKLLRVLEAARRAPTAGHSQGVRFGVVQEFEARRRIAELLGEAQYAERGFPRWLGTAPVHLLVGVRPLDYHLRYAEPDKLEGPDSWPVPYSLLDGGKALMLLYLSALAEGLGTGFLGAHRATPAFELYPELSDLTPLGLVTLGYPDRANDRRPRSWQRGWREFDETVRWLDP